MAVADIPLTAHAQHRQMQRNIPHLIVEWLIHYGESTYLGDNGKARFFTKRTIRRLEQEVGKKPVRLFSDFLACYLILDGAEQVVVTMGKRFKKTRFMEKMHIRRHPSRTTNRHRRRAPEHQCPVVSHAASAAI